VLTELGEIVGAHVLCTSVCTIRYGENAILTDLRQVQNVIKFERIPLKF